MSRHFHILDRRFYLFESALTADKIAASMKDIMQKTDMATLLSETSHDMIFKVKRKGRCSSIHVNISVVLKDLHIVEIKRASKGDDAIAYHKFMAEVGPQISKQIGPPNQGPSGITVKTPTEM